MENKKTMLKNQKGFTLIEIIAVLVILGILAAVAIPKYMDMQTTARIKAAQGQIAEVKGRLSMTLSKFMLDNGGAVPANGAALVTQANTNMANSCPPAATTEGDYEFSCNGDGTAQTVAITVSKVQTVGVTASGTYIFTQ